MNRSRQGRLDREIAAALAATSRSSELPRSRRPGDDDPELWSDRDVAAAIRRHLARQYPSDLRSLRKFGEVMEEVMEEAVARRIATGAAGTRAEIWEAILADHRPSSGRSS